MWSPKTSILLATLLSHQVAVANAAGCSFCQDGSVTDADVLISLSDPNVMHTCKDWQQKPELTAGFSEEACKFIAPFYEATCDCSVRWQTHEECHLCGLENLEFADPQKGLIIPNSNSQEILCHTIFDGVKAGAVPPTDCQVLRGITDYCGGCVQKPAAFADPFDTVVPRNNFPGEKIASFPENANPTPHPTLGNVSPTPQPTLETFVGEVAKFPEIGNAEIAQAATMPPSAGPSEIPSASPSSLSPTDGPSDSPSVSGSESPTAIHSGEPTFSPTSSPTASPSVAHSSNPTSSPTTGPSGSPSIAHSSSPTVAHSDGPTSSPTTGPSGSPSVAHSSSPTVAHSDGPTSSPTTGPSDTPTGAPSSGPTVSPTTATPTSIETPMPTAKVSLSVEASLVTTTPTAAETSIPTSTASMTAETSIPTSTASMASSIQELVISNVATSTSPTMAPYSTSTSFPSASPTSLPSIMSNLRDSVINAEESYSCDLCPGGTLEHPSKIMSLAAMENKTITKTCGALLWDARSGRNDIDEHGCSFLLPFFGAICGCSSFTPFAHTDKVEKKVCKLCDNKDDVFQAVHKALPIPGSENTEITCSGVYAGAVDGAVTESECDALATIADHCGGCGTENKTFYELFYEEVLSPKQCVDCSGVDESSLYVYKDFGSSGTTFHKAFNAPSHCADRTKKDKQKECTNLLYPELESCVLTPITSFEELLRVQAVIPPGKAAYTAVTKDSLVLRSEAKECYATNENHGIEVIDIQISRMSGIRKQNCKVENWMEGLTYGVEEIGSNPKLAKLTNLTDPVDPCEAMKTGWTNYKTGEDVPSELWEGGQLSFCSLGPVQDVAGVWAVESNGQNYGDMRDVSMNWPLPGAVYKCCKTIYNCLEHLKSKIEEVVFEE